MEKIAKNVVGILKKNNLTAEQPTSVNTVNADALSAQSVKIWPKKTNSPPDHNVRRANDTLRKLKELSTLSSSANTD